MEILYYGTILYAISITCRYFTCQVIGNYYRNGSSNHTARLLCTVPPPRMRPMPRAGADGWGVGAGGYPSGAVTPRAEGLDTRGQGGVTRLSVVTRGRGTGSAKPLI
jgi:hypothetical protein